MYYVLKSGLFSRKHLNYGDPVEIVDKDRAKDLIRRQIISASPPPAVAEPTTGDAPAPEGDRPPVTPSQPGPGGDDLDRLALPPGNVSLLRAAGLTQVAQLTEETLTGVKGIGPASRASILAAVTAANAE